jgi:glycosyltransferase involved in cell wall biosynthesis
MKLKIIRVTTIPESIAKLLEGQLRFVSQFYQVIAVSSDKENLKKVGKIQNVSTFSVHLTRKITPWKDLKALIKLYRFFKKEKPFIVHTHTPKAGTIGMIAAKLTGVPLRLHTIAGLPLLEARGLKRKLLNFVERVTYACATNIYPNSFKMKDIILENKFCSPHKLKVIGKGSTNGINSNYFWRLNFTEEQQQNLKDELHLKDEFVYLFVGRLVTDKGINELVSSFIRLYESNMNTRLLLVGPQEPERDPLLPKTIETIYNHPAIIRVGYQADVRLYYTISHVLVFPSYREGFPNVVMQAGAMELPAIVSDINGCNEIIENGVNGIIIPPKNEDELFKAMNCILENRDLYKHLKENARKQITNRYEQEFVWNEILKEYKRLESQLK